MADDTEDEDSGSGQPQQTAQPAQAQQPFSVASAVYNGLIQRGVKPDVAYGALGSLMGESGRSLNTGSVNRGDGSDGSDSLGFGQWNGARAQNLQATAAGMNVPWNSGEAQTAHLFNELDGKYRNGNYGGVLKALQNGQSVADGNSIWTRQYEVPANVDAQVAARLSHGMSLAQGAQQGTLDLSKIGSFDGGNQNTPNARAFQANAGGDGALSGNNIAGGNPGALYDTTPQEPTMSQRMVGVAAALASINNPAQASALNAQLAQMKSGQQNPLDTALKRAQLQNYLKNQTTAQQPTKVGLTDDKKGVIMQKPDGTSYVAPIAGINGYQTPTTPDVAPEMSTNDMKSLQTSSLGAAKSASAIDDANSLITMLGENPEIAKNMGIAQDGKAYLANAQGESTPTSMFLKKFNALDASARLALIQNLPAKAQNMKLQALEGQSITPPGAQYDPLTLVDSITRGSDLNKDSYQSQMNVLQNLEQKYGKKLQFVDPYTQNQSTPTAYHNANLKRWDNADDLNGDYYDNVIKPNHDIATGAAPSRVQSIKTMFGVK